MKDQLKKLVELQKKAQEIHPLFTNHYPVTVVCCDMFEIYDVLPGKSGYELIQIDPCPFTIPQGVRAAFPLESYNNKMSAIVSGEAFDSLDGYIEVLHEFVHCYQGEECEFELKNQLKITKEYLKKNDFMWEIEHPFSYNKQEFIELFARYLDALKLDDYDQVLYLRKKFKEVLSEFDLEYLLWQEWKEGLARYLENRMKRYMKVEENHYGFNRSYNRISLYESGSLFISILEKIDPLGVHDISRLFAKMKESVSC